MLTAENTNSHVETLPFKASSISICRYAIGESNETIFALGSYDNANFNQLSIWSYSTSERTPPQKFLHAFHEGDINDIEYVNSMALAVASSTGSVNIYNMEEDLVLVRSFDKLFNKSSSCLTVVNGYICACCEDGSISVLSPEHQEPVLNLVKADDFCIVDAVPYQNGQLMTANTLGQVKIWDLRSNSNTPMLKFNLTKDLNSLLCICVHPHQPKVIAGGTDDGKAIFTDIRQNKNILNTIAAHQNYPIYDIKFHPLFSNYFFSASADGTLLRWNLNQSNLQGEVSANQWLLSSKWSEEENNLENLIPPYSSPVNSLDIHEDLVLCATDSSFAVIRPEY